MKTGNQQGVYMNIYYPIALKRLFVVTLAVESMLSAYSHATHMGFHFDSEENNNVYLVSYSDSNLYAKYFMIIGI